MDGTFTIPSRIYLSREQRDRLERLLRHQDRELDELLSELMIAYLAEQPDPPAPVHDHAAEITTILRQRRRELRRLQQYIHDPHNPPPQFLIAMVAELEAEVRRLEHEVGQAAS